MFLVISTVFRARRQRRFFGLRPPKGFELYVRRERAPYK